MGQAGDSWVQLKASAMGLATEVPLELASTQPHQGRMSFLQGKKGKIVAPTTCCWGPLIFFSPEDKAEMIEEARRLAKSFRFWVR